MIHDAPRRSDAPRLSIVIPTFGREESLQRLLNALARQQGAPPFDVIVVLDGVPEASIGAGRREWPFPLRVVEQPSRGAAAARNAGAQLAQSEVLLFLDDDVEPAERVIRAHAEFHASRRRGIGAGDLAPVPTETGFISTALTGWWETMCGQLRDPRHRFTFRDLLTGHCSVTRATFEQLGRFDESLLCHEDFEFGYRAIEAGATIRFVPGSDARHHDTTTLEKVLRRKRDEGIADVQLVAKHPSLLRALPLGRPVPGGICRRAFDAALRGARRDAVFGGGLVRLLHVLERASMRDKWRVVLDAAMAYAYWRGAVEYAGGTGALGAIRARPDPPQSAPVVIDLRAGLTQAEEQIDRERPTAVRIVLGDAEVGIVLPVAGAEPFRGEHLRPVLLHQLAGPLAAAASRVGILPSVLHGEAAARPQRKDVVAAGAARVA
ncbi:MAG: glycosyltransferase family 2 protein [Vicinamibacterales bacterium]